MLPFHGLQQLLFRSSSTLAHLQTHFLPVTDMETGGTAQNTDSHSSTPGPEGFQAQNPPALVQPGIRCKFKCMFKGRFKKKCMVAGRMLKIGVAIDGWMF